MIYIDLPADLNLEDDQGRNAARLADAVTPDAVTPGAVLVAGAARAWSWAVVESVDGGFVYFRQISDRVLICSDYPYLRRDLAVSCRQHIQASPELTNHKREAILGGTAATLIPRLATLRPTTSTHHYAIGPDNEPMTRSLNGCSQDKHDSCHEWPPDVTHGGLGHHGEGR